MGSKDFKSLRRYLYLPVFIEEDHHDVVPHIHRAIASRHLPMSELILVHFDSHPDLLLPLSMPADHVFDKQELYSSLSIENWILPLVYAGHLSEIYWLRPPWAHQLPAGLLKYGVGRCRETGKLRMTCPDPYFLTEALYAPESQLSDTKEVTLHVITITPDGWDSHDQEDFKSESGITVITSTCLGSSHSQDKSPESVLHGEVDRGCSTKHDDDSAAKMSSVLVSNYFENSSTQAESLGKPKSNKSSFIGQEQDSGMQLASIHDADDQVASVTDFVGEKRKVCLNNLHDCIDALTEKACGDQKPAKQRKLKLAPNCEPEFAQSSEKAKEQQIPDMKCALEPFSVDLMTCESKSAASSGGLEWSRELRDKLGSQPYILDVDLDFFSTKDPFRDVCTPEQTALLRELFGYQLPKDNSVQALAEFTKTRQAQLEELEKAFEALEKDPDKVQDILQTHRQAAFEKLTQSLQSDHGTTAVDYQIIYQAGCTMDETELPHHVSSAAEIQQLIEASCYILKNLPPPTIITIARSSEDDYCPKHQVEKIQEAMLDVLTHVYQNIGVKKLYTEKLPASETS